MTDNELTALFLPPEPTRFDDLTEQQWDEIVEVCCQEFEKAGADYCVEDVLIGVLIGVRKYVASLAMSNDEFDLLLVDLRAYCRHAIGKFRIGREIIDRVTNWLVDRFTRIPTCRD